ncbi:Tab2/Atab2 family RNA-binding protein [Spirulina sp. CS-785/01]|uniref:Tab2 family RNA-binding protein n=1 Tax=Spirulina sp. CS-785/01 TaxID=3021716 RepID=UPI00232BCA1B|nr:Tab2 family RNA-binding protein [Spirulina sp. CS-785/01]MDB9313596.1 Tab2/Atab2 family RNA-binding protein [Spirulina sp. CS-785/01]
MTNEPILQADLTKLPSRNSQIDWLLLVCDGEGNVVVDETCPQSNVNSDWVFSQLKTLQPLPQAIQVFRPQAVGLLQRAADELGVSLETTRRTLALKSILQQRGVNIDLEQAPPQPLPENLWGDQWRFVSLSAGDVFEAFSGRPIPIQEMPASLNPLNFGIASNTPIPGILIYGGRQSMQLARWLWEVKPYGVTYIPTETGKSGGLVLESGLRDRWILATFEDEAVAKAAETYQQRFLASQGLHFLVIEPDESGMTTTAVWLLKRD